MGRLDELSNTPDHTDGDVVFNVTHPFHSLHGQQFSLLAQRFTWGEPRVFFHDPTTSHVRSIPTDWTDLAPQDPFIQQAAGRATLRLADLQALQHLLSDLQTVDIVQQEGSE